MGLKLQLGTMSQAQIGADVRSVEAYAKTIETKYYAGKVMGEKVTITTVEVTTDDYSGDAVTGCSRSANADGTNLVLTGCRVGDRPTVFNYINGKAIKANN